jgi:hypothetical protein
LIGGFIFGAVVDDKRYARLRSGHDISDVNLRRYQNMVSEFAKHPKNPIV